MSLSKNLKITGFAMLCCSLLLVVPGISRYARTHESMIAELKNQQQQISALQTSLAQQSSRLNQVMRQKEQYSLRWIKSQQLNRRLIRNELNHLANYSAKLKELSQHQKCDSTDEVAMTKQDWSDQIKAKVQTFIGALDQGSKTQAQHAQSKKTIEKSNAHNVIGSKKIIKSIGLKKNANVELEQDGSVGYHRLQVGVFSSQQHADRLIHLLKNAGFPVITEIHPRARKSDLIKVIVLIHPVDKISSIRKKLANKFHLKSLKLT